MTVRGVMFQYFEWNCKADSSLWKELTKNAQEIANLGTTAIWLPPAYKGMNGKNDTGYAPYDLYDLGEFDQKGSVETKYGTKDEYLEAIKAAHAAGMDVYADIVLNHKMGGDELEEVEVLDMDRQNRLSSLCEKKIKAYSKYNYDARGGKYSQFKWNKNHFTAFGYDAESKADGIYLVKGLGFSGEVDNEYGNYDYLMGADVNHYNPEVFKELCDWGEWYEKFTGINGFRLDAVKHIPHTFFSKWFKHLKEKFPDKEQFGVGEYWSPDVSKLQNYLQYTDGCMRLFDVPLHFNFHRASQQGRDYDLRQIFDGTLVKENPALAVTFVDNHDSQPGQSLQSWVEDWFKPLAYALILLRVEGYPCLFYGDYFGSEGECGGQHSLTRHRKIIDDLLEARHKYAHGDIYDYFDHPQCIGWTWSGDAEHESSMAVLMSTGDSGVKKMKTHCNNQTFRDITGHCTEPVTTDENGEADFFCSAGSVSVWVSR